MKHIVQIIHTVKKLILSEFYVFFHLHFYKQVRGLHVCFSNVKVRRDLKTSSDEICVISTFDTDHQIVEVTKKYTSNLSLTKSFSSSNTAQTGSSSKSNNSVFKYVKCTGPSLKNKLMQVKDLALGKHGKTEPCNKSWCKLCEVIISDHTDLTVNGFKITSVCGLCTTYNIIYLFLCTIYTKPYVGRTVSSLNI